MVSAEYGEPKKTISERGSHNACTTGRAGSIEWFAEEGRRIQGDVLQTVNPNTRFLTQKSPVGVVGAITPWNFPMSMITRKVSPALAAGCTVSSRILSMEYCNPPPPLLSALHH